LLLGTAERRDLFLTVLEKMRQRYRFAVIGYVIMPEHVHLLISEPQIANPSTVVQAVKLGFARRVLNLNHVSCDARHHVWFSRFYDFNLWSQGKEIEKLKYMHRNPGFGVWWRIRRNGAGAVIDLMRMEKVGWFASTTGRGGKRRFEQVFAEVRFGTQKPHF
jgi:REP element-mobilizing transposase RayT